MALARWRTIVTNLSYVPQGELFNATDRSLSMALSRTDTASLTVRTDNPLADLLQGLDCYIKMYRDNTLMFFGLVLNSEESVDAQGGHITINAAGPGWVFPKRYPVRQATGFPIVGPRARIVQSLIGTMNTQWPTFTPQVDAVLWNKSQGELGIRWDGGFSTVGGSITYNAEPYKPFSEMLDELSNATDGFEWRIKAYENWVNGALVALPNGLKTGTISFGAPLGSTKPEAIFEFGDGRVNVTSYTRVKSRETQANAVTHLLNGQPESSPAVAHDTGNEAVSGVGVMEDIVQADITNLSYRQSLVDEHVAVRKLPRNIVQFEPMSDYGDSRLPRFGVDYDLGDFVTGRARVEGKIRFNGQFRVWGVDWTVNSNGVERPKLLLEYQS